MWEGRAEPCPYGVGGCKREIQRKQKGDTKEKGKREKKKETGGIGNHKRKRSFLGKA